MDTCSCEYLWYKGNTNFPWGNEQGEKIMANRIYNKQVSPKGYKMGGRVKKMGGGSLKAVKPNQKGLAKLPKNVRNKMGYMKKGGKV